MKKAIYYRLITLTSVAILLCSLVGALIYAVRIEDQTKEWLRKLTLSVAENYQYNQDVAALSLTAGNNRITIISADGEVLADSEVGATHLPNHANREEIKHAQIGQVYINTRKSSTLGNKFMYSAIRTADGNILRLSYNYQGLLHNVLIQLPAILVATATALFLSLFLARWFTKTITSPLEKIVQTLSLKDYSPLPPYQTNYYEIDKLMLSIQRLLHEIEESNIKLRSEKEKINYILSNMTEGFVLLDNQQNILLCNNRARSFFSRTARMELNNIYTLTRNHKILEAIQLALEKGQSSSFELELDEKLITSVLVSPSEIAGTEIGATMLMVDITGEKELEQQKRDFFSNASHELKTPVTSILGFSEMLNKDMVSGKEERSMILEKIETEARRLSALINDILAISKLESNIRTQEYTDLNLREIVQEAASSVSPLQEQLQIELTMELEDLMFRGSKRQLYELCVNLIENAVKYNRPGGKVNVSLKKEKDNAVLQVQDTGIGISPEHQGRIFERFFRVDYGRDKKVGGTGLGLSIVKHIVNSYNGSILLKSEKNRGTTFTVRLPLRDN